MMETKRAIELYLKYKDDKDANDYALLKSESLRKKAFAVGLFGGFVIGTIAVCLLLLLL